MGPYIQAKNISLTFRPKDREPVTALDGFTLDVAKGEFVSLVGPSGYGKSTFLNILLGLLGADTGDIRMNGTAITAAWGDETPPGDRNLFLSSSGQHKWPRGRS